MKKYLSAFLLSLSLTGFIVTSEALATFIMRPVINKLEDLAKGPLCPKFCTKANCSDLKNPHDYATCALLCSDKTVISECLSSGKNATEKAFGTSDPYRLLARADVKPERLGWRAGKTRMCSGTLCNDKTCASPTIQKYCSALCRNASEGIAAGKEGQTNYGDLMQGAKNCQIAGWTPAAPAVTPAATTVTVEKGKEEVKVEVKEAEKVKVEVTPAPAAPTAAPAPPAAPPVTPAPAAPSAIPTPPTPPSAAPTPGAPAPSLQEQLLQKQKELKKTEVQPSSPSETGKSEMQKQMEEALKKRRGSLEPEEDEKGSPVEDDDDWND